MHENLFVKLSEFPTEKLKAVQGGDCVLDSKSEAMELATFFLTARDVLSDVRRVKAASGQRLIRINELLVLSHPYWALNRKLADRTHQIEIDYRNARAEIDVASSEAKSRLKSVIISGLAASAASLVPALIYQSPWTLIAPCTLLAATTFGALTSYKKLGRARDRDAMKAIEAATAHDKATEHRRKVTYLAHAVCDIIDPNLNGDGLPMNSDPTNMLVFRRPAGIPARRPLSTGSKYV